MANAWCTQIDNLMYWRSNSWVKCDITGPKQLHLRVYYDQLIIIADTKILESINMSCKMKGIYKEDVLILLLCAAGKDIRKFKFRVVFNATQAFKKLGQHFPIVKHNCTQRKMIMKPKFTKIEEVLKQVLDNKDIITSLSSSPVEENFVKMCLLDPKFQHTVLETKTIIDLINK